MHDKIKEEEIFKIVKSLIIHLKGREEKEKNPKEIWFRWVGWIRRRSISMSHGICENAWEN